MIALRRPVRFFLAAAVLAALSGCSWFRGPAPPEVYPDERRAARELIDNLQKRSAALKSLRTLASVYYTGADGKGGFREIVLVRRPDRLRLETLSPLGALLIVTASAEEIAGFHTREGVLYRGKSSPQNLYRYTHIPLGLDELTSVLVGLPPLAPGSEWKNDGPEIVRDLGGGWKDAVVFQAGEPLPLRWQRKNPAGEVEVSAHFGEFSRTAAGLFPMRIVLESPTQNRKLEIDYKEPEVNVELAPALFVQKKPDKAREVSLDSVGG